MHFKTVELPQGERINAAAQGADIAICFWREKGIYRAVCRDFRQRPFLEPAALIMYSDEACPLCGGGMAERKNSTIKIHEG